MKGPKAKPKAQTEAENSALREENARLRRELLDLRIEAQAVEASLRRTLVELAKEAAAERRARELLEDRPREAGGTEGAS